MGHKRIGVIATADYSTVRERIKGYSKALEDYNILFEEDMIVSVPLNDKDEAQNMTSQLLDRHSDMTAIYVLNNSLCNGVLLEFKKRNLRIAEDMSLLVWDDEALNELYDITTVVQQIEKIGKLATKKLIELICNSDKEVKSGTEILETHMICRKSCGRINR